jgi:DNA-binding NtrC family response regulator
VTKQKIAVLDQDRSAGEEWRLRVPAGMDVDVFFSEDEFIASAKIGEYDCLLLETPAARRLHLELDGAGVSTPLIYLAEQASIAEAIAAIKLGAADYLSKPVAAEELAVALEAAARQKRSGVPERFWGAEITLEPKLDGLERELICTALQRSKGVVGGRRGAAALLGVTRTGLLYKMKRLGINRALMAASEPEHAPENTEDGRESASAAAIGKF